MMCIIFQMKIRLQNSIYKQMRGKVPHPTLFKCQVLRVCTVKGENMMYESKLAAAIKVNGKVLREFKDTVYVPFGSEYSILLKNLHTIRVVVNVFIDGTDMVPGGLILNAGQEVDLERSIKNGNLTEGNRFKFVERTGSVEKHRGVKLEDGLVRVEFQYEQPRPVFNQPWISASGSSSIYPQGGILRNSTADWAGPVGSVTCSATSAYINQINDAGITVPGSKSTQKFNTTYIGALESDKHSMVFRLLGGEAVKEAVTVKHKPKCVTCGKQNKATSKFCQECGTALEIFA